MDVNALPARVAHVTHALIEAAGPYAFKMGALKTREVMLYDSESFSMGSTYGALCRAMRLGLVDRISGSPSLWIPTNTAMDIHPKLEARFLAEVHGDV